MPDAPPPVVARVCRGGRTESRHRGTVAVTEPAGRLVASAGDPESAVYLRSAVKPFQAIPLLVAGGAHAFRLTDEDIAVMCASHGGEPRHVRAVRRMLRRGGFDESDLACGAQEPMDLRSARALAARGEPPTALHNNCSGNHAGLLLACRRLGLASPGYEKPSHPLQRAILSLVSKHTGVAARDIGIAVDGCGLPVYSLPLSGLARAYAFLAEARGETGETEKGGDVDARAGQRLWTAMCRSPEMVAGRGRFTTAFLEAGGGAWIGKEGAEGVYAIAVARRGGHGPLGIAFKIEDGSTRARDAVALEIMAALGRLDSSAERRLSPYRVPVLRNTRGAVVGEIVAEVLLDRGRFVRRSMRSADRR